MTRRTFRAGVLEVTADFQSDRITAINVPEQIPDGLEPAMLADLLEQLSKFPIQWPNSGPFTRRIWEELQKIPAGTALTYAELAEAVGNPKAVRAVGQACGSNHLPLLVPCHRVVAEAGPGGFGLGLDWKFKLLELEAEFWQLAKQPVSKS